MTEEMCLQMFPNKDSDDADVTFSSRVFHSRTAATEKIDRQRLKDRCIRQQAMMLKQI